ncbi:MAG: AraC family transcriptional regulator [Verrucomicrobiaceae bacterium]|nr:AraC family transcriptional regulator [Verrucomicrobiaceae bacterium]
MTPDAPNSWSQLRLEWLWVYDGMVPVTGVWSDEIVVPASVFFVVEGEGRIQADGRKSVVRVGDAFLAAAGVRRQWFAHGTRLLSVGFRASWPSGMNLSAKGLNCVVSGADMKSLAKATRRLFRTIHGRKTMVGFRDAVKAAPVSFAEWARQDAAFRAWFAEYVATLSSRGVFASEVARTTDERVLELMRRLDHWPLDEVLDGSRWVEGLPFGVRRAEQLIGKQLGITPHQHLMRRRLDLARSMLTNSTNSIKVIAHRIGLRHASHFTKWFRRHVGVTPLSYRLQPLGDGV